jgi:hypothetical protein
MAENIFGDGAEVVGASYSGDNDSSGIYTNGDSVAPGVTPSDTGVILSTGDAEDITNSSGQSNQSTSTSTNTSGVNNDSDFNALAGMRTYDAAFLEIDFIPDGNQLSLQFTFASDEYPEYVGSIFNDTVGVWVNGSPVDITVGSGTTTDVFTVNPNNNENLYYDNTGEQYNTEMDGFTATLTLKFGVLPGEVNSLKIGIADVGDSSFDSSMLIAGGSVQSAVTAVDDDVEMSAEGRTIVDLVGNDLGPDGATLVLTHINGIAVSAGDVITLSTGQQIQINGDGTITLIGDGDEESFNFSYTIGVDGDEDNSDTAFVTVDAVPCFVAGTMIETESGPVAVETLRPGQLVKTRDHGMQPLRWIGRRTVQASGDFAPVRIEAGAFGAHDALMVSPQHRILIRDALAELLFEEAEVLVAAKHLVDGEKVRVLEGESVEYVHILFDSHEVVYSAGLASESFLPGPQTTASFEQELLAEICSLFPELDPRTGAGYSPAARRVLKAYEARLLVRQDAAA